MLNVFAIGNLTRDPEKTDKGCRLSIACNALDDTVDYLTVYAYGKAAEVHLANLHKGDKVAVTGRFHCNIHETEENIYLNETVNAYSIEYLTKRKTSETENKPAESKPEQRKRYRS